MKASFWHDKWKINDIAFHQSEVNPLLDKHFKKLLLVEGNRVFLPLCGKTLDIAWLLSGGYCVVGVELSELAIEQLFIGLGVEPVITEVNGLKHYRAKNIDIFVGDIFDLTIDVIGPVDAVYDRAALVALPEEMRVRYTAHLLKITNSAPQLLLCFEYNQNLMEGPPFSIESKEIDLHYKNSYSLNLIESTVVPEKLKGECEAKENVWLLIKDDYL